MATIKPAFGRMKLLRKTFYFFVFQIANGNHSIIMTDAAKEIYRDRFQEVDKVSRKEDFYIKMHFLPAHPIIYLAYETPQV